MNFDVGSFFIGFVPALVVGAAVAFVVVYFIYKNKEVLKS